MAAKLSGSSGGKFSVEQNAEINVTPFVDVMLVLLIIFMVAAPLASVSVRLKLPPAVAVPTPNPPKPVYISIQRSGRLYIGDAPTDLDTIGNDLRHFIGKRDPEHERIFIRADRDTLYRDFMGVMDKLQDEGFYSVALIGTDQRGGAGNGAQDDDE
jgi:biopolymer transport protein ExbD